MAAAAMRELAAEAAGGPRRRLYDRDFWAWTQEQARALRRRDFGAIDWDNVIEEVESKRVLGDHTARMSSRTC